MDAFECDGRWWLPGEEQTGVAGTLKVSDEGGMTLSVIGSLGEMKNAFAEKLYPIILGSVDKGPKGNEVTLTGSFRTGATMGSFKDVRESYHVDRAYFGALLPKEASFAFKSMRLQLGGLTEWLHTLSGFEQKGTGVGQVGETVPLGFYTRREPVRAAVPGGAVAVGLGFRSGFSATRYEFQEAGQIKVTCDAPISADEFHMRYGYALRCLMTFVCDRAQTIERFSVWRPEAPDQEILVVGELVQPDDEATKDPVSWHEMLFTLGDVEFPDFIQRWFALTEVYKEACNVYFGLLYGRPSYLDVKFQNVANAVHLYYERGEDGAARREADTLRMKKILASQSDSDKEWLIDRLGVNPRTPLRAALAHLLEKSGAVIDPLITGRRERFVEAVLGTLEYTVRRDRDLEAAAMAGADLYWLTEKLRFLLKACFMREAGFSPEAVQRCFTKNALYQHIHHQELARESSASGQAAVGQARPPASEQPAGGALRPTGSPEMETFWELLGKESPRGRAVGIAAYFDESLSRLLGDREESLASKISTAHRRGLLTNNERDDLNAIRNLRNLVVHRVGGPQFHEDEKAIVGALKTWRIAADAVPKYREMIATAEDRLLYVAAIIAIRLAHRSGGGGGQPLSEPDFTDVRSWPPISNK
jgi:hypothetical protein